MTHLPPRADARQPLDRDDQKLLALMTKRVGVTLRLQRVNGIVRSATGPGQYMVWEIAR